MFICLMYFLLPMDPSFSNLFLLLGTYSQSLYLTDSIGKTELTAAHVCIHKVFLTCVFFSYGNIVIIREHISKLKQQVFYN